jgi:solute carrier family 30 (zinc transporter), member 9
MAGDGDSKGAVFAALLVNTGLAVLKFVAFGITGSGSMFSEAMHTLADAANQGLLFIGIKRSEKAADEKFSYGYGGERFLFALMSAAGIFVLGFGVTVYHGIHSLMHPKLPDIKWWLFVILGISFVLNGWVLYKAVAAINKMRGKQSFKDFLKTTNDPTIAAVLLEDGIACGGVIIAVICIALSAMLRSPVPDAIGSLIIGSMLGFVAIWLGIKNRSLILGVAIPAEARKAAVDYLEAQPSIERVRFVQTKILGAGAYKLKAEIDWRGSWFGDQQLAWLAENKAGLADDATTRAFATEIAERITNALAHEIDRIEHELVAKIPELKFIDLESDAPTGLTQVITKA